ncbi:hypothetical protein SLEP1_g42832 [Rubroshorea leprosula]|uniref:Uncharacterized protein n=1 Tax=Rubroshorea leprosula TaxID=152421 RepID=A0AAV5LB48_9ROSI|nr:hypothetical protein SLEP1_g42832 [Rubroshorea leprosula]
MGSLRKSKSRFSFNRSRRGKRRKKRGGEGKKKKKKEEEGKEGRMLKIKQPMLCEEEGCLDLHSGELARGDVEEDERTKSEEKGKQGN